MQHIDRLGKAHSVDRTERVAVEVVNDLQHTCVAQPLQWLRVGRLAADLGFPQRAADPSPHLFRETAQVLLAAADPPHRLGLVSVGKL